MVSGQWSVVAQCKILTLRSFTACCDTLTHIRIVGVVTRIHDLLGVLNVDFIVEVVRFMVSSGKKRNHKGGVARGLLSSMVIAGGNRMVDQNGGCYSLISVARATLGPNHPEVAYISQLLSNSIRRYRKQVGDAEDNVFVSRNGRFDHRVWKFLLVKNKRKGIAGFRFRDLLLERLEHTPDQGVDDIEDMVALLDAMEAPEMVAALDVLEGSEARELSERGRRLVEAVRGCSRQAVRDLLIWMDHRHAEQLGHVEIVQETAVIFVPDHEPVLTRSMLQTLEACREESHGFDTDPEYVDAEVTEEKKPGTRWFRMPRLPFKWLAAALVMVCLVGIASPVLLTHPRQILAEQGLNAAYAAVLDMLASGRVNGRQLRDAAVIFYRKGELDRARAILEDIVDDHGYDDKLRADCYMQLGRIELSSDPEQALPLFHQADRLYIDHQRNHSALAMARAHMALGDYAMAELHLNLARDLREIYGKGNQVMEWVVAGKLAQHQGHYKNALEFSIKGYELGLEKNQRDRIADFATQLGLIYALIGDVENARRYTDEANSIYGATGDRVSFVDSQVNYILISRLEGKETPHYILKTINQMTKKTQNQDLRKKLEYVTTVPLSGKK